MSLGEFQLIERFFARSLVDRDDVVLGVGDDAALVKVPAGMELVVAADTIVSGVHFPHDLAPELIGYRALAVNLSDMAAMGAEPAWFTLSLTLPAAEEQWLEKFSGGLLELARAHRTALIGGDTTSGPLSIAVQILGLAPAGTAIRRSGAHEGDIVCLSGTVGDAAAGLRLLKETSRSSAEDRSYLIKRFVCPTPRVELGKLLRGKASAAMDVSDGLYADLGKLVAASGVGARLDIDAVPLSAALSRCFDVETAREWALAGGDDYELCFTVPPQRMDEIRQVAGQLGLVIHSIGRVEATPGVRCYDAGRPVELQLKGYDHFGR